MNWLRRRLEILVGNDFAVFALLAGILIVIYGQNFTGGWFTDDDVLDMHVFDLWSAPDGLARIWAGERPPVEDHYRPVADSVIWLACQLPVDTALTLRLLNLSAHIAFVLIGLALLRTLRVPGATWACILFALHPVCVQSVTWAIQVRGMLANVFAIVAALLAIKHHQTGQIRWAVAAVLAMTLGALSKTTIVGLPVVLFILSLGCRVRLTCRDYILLILMLVPCVITVRYGSAVPVDKAVLYGSIAERALDIFVWYLKYLHHALNPFAIEYAYPFGMSIGEYVILGVAGGALLCLFSLGKRREALVAFSVLFAFGVSIGPKLLTWTMTSLFTSAQDRYQYMGMFMLIAYLVAAAARMHRRTSARWAPVSTIGVVIVALVLSLMSAWGVARFDQPIRFLDESADAPDMTHEQQAFLAMVASELAHSDAERIHCYERVQIFGRGIGDSGLALWAAKQLANVRCIADDSACRSLIQAVPGWEQEPTLVLLLAHNYLETSDVAARDVDRAHQLLEKLLATEPKLVYAMQALFVEASMLAQRGRFFEAQNRASFARIWVVSTREAVGGPRYLPLRDELAARIEDYGRRIARTNPHAMRYWQATLRWQYRYEWP